MAINYIQTKSSKPRVKKKHFISITHYLEGDSYVKTQVVYRWSHQFVKRYDNVDIYNTEEYSWLVKGFENRNTIVRGIDVSYENLSEQKKASIRKVEAVPIADEIILSLPEVHYEIDETDTEFFRMRSINYTYIGGVNWIQDQLRPALYINSIDTTARFDGNSILMRIDINKANKKLTNDIDRINSCEFKNKKENISVFVGHLFSYTMMLYYINISHGWKFEDITYDKLWNLAMYFLSFAKPFRGKETADNKKDRNDWIKGVKLSYLRFLFERRAYNELSKGVKHFYRSLAQGKLLEKSTRYCFPSNMNKLNKELFKSDHPKPKTVHQEVLENRNKQIKELRDKGYSERNIALVLDISRSLVHKVLSTS